MWHCFFLILWTCSCWSLVKLLLAPPSPRDGKDDESQRSVKMFVMAEKIIRQPSITQKNVPVWQMVDVLEMKSGRTDGRGILAAAAILFTLVGWGEMLLLQY